MKKRLIILALVLFSFSCSSFAKPKAVAYLMPKGFTGGVIILYDQADGITPEVANDGTILYRIPKDGLLKVNSDFPQDDVYRYNFYYIDDKDNLTPIEYVLPEGSFVPPNTNQKNIDMLTAEEKNDGIFAMNHRTIGFVPKGRNMLLYAFSIGHPKDVESLYSKTLDKVDEIRRNIE